MNSLEHFDQLYLLERNWKELFLLTAIQNNYQFDELISATKHNLDSSNHQNGNHRNNKSSLRSNDEDSTDDECSSPPSKKFMNSSVYQQNSQNHKSSNVQKNAADENTDDKLKQVKKEKSNGIKSIISILKPDEPKDKVRLSSKMLTTNKKKFDDQTLNKEPVKTTISLLKEIDNFSFLVYMCKQLSLDSREMDFLKTICLYRTEQKNTEESIRSTKICNLLSHSKVSFNSYLTNKIKDNPEIRINQLVYAMDQLIKFSETEFDSLFFRSTIREMPITNLIAYLFNS